MSTDAWSLALPDAASTETLGRCVAATRRGPAVVHLDGELGAGKTTLVRALLRHLGVAGPVRSPTYTLVETYPLPDGPALHLDLYRIADPDELEFLALDIGPAGAALWLVEWPAHGGDRLPRPDLRISLAYADSGRSASLQGCSPVGAAWCARIKDAFSQDPVMTLI